MPQVKCPWCGEKVIYLTPKFVPYTPIKPTEESCPFCYGDIEILEGIPSKKEVKRFH